MTARLCGVPECGRGLLAKGLCSMHYARKLRTGSVGGAAPRVPGWKILYEWVRSRERSVCWTDFPRTSAAPGGYPELRIDNRTVLASHVVMEYDGREKPKGMEALHSCDTPICVNPEHLSWGTRSQNMREKYERRPPTPKTKKPCPECGLPHRDHDGAMRWKRWYVKHQMRELHDEV